MSTFYTFQIKGENIVAHLTLFNPISAAFSIPAVIDVALEKPILLKASDYKMTVVRFDDPLYSVYPCYEMAGRVFMIRFRNTAGNTFVRSISGDNIVGFSIMNFINILNQLLGHLTVDMNHTEKEAPYFTFDENTGKFYLIKCYTVYNDLIAIDLSKDLHYFMSGFPAYDLNNGFFAILLSGALNDNTLYLHLDIIIMELV